jgi:O-acetyl-ADP-ribose deacetylase (regulator of RNase III)
MSGVRNGPEVVLGDLFESEAQTLVNTVNCVGVMGKGIAAEFKRRFPDMFADYQARCSRGEVQLGRPYLFPTLFPPHILNFPTKGDWRAATRLVDIIEGLDYLFQHYEEWGITSLAVPPLGCGHGGLDWSIVGPTLYRELLRFDIPVKLYAPYGTPHEELQPRYLQRTLESVGSSDDLGVAPAPRLEAGWVALAAILARVEADPHHWPIGRTSFQKLAYFADIAGIPTGLVFTKGQFGPYADGLTTVASKLANNGLIHEANLGRMKAVRVGPTFEAAAKTNTATLANWSSAIARVADLFARFPTTREAEIAATVHFAATRLVGGGKGVPSEQEVVDAVLDWKASKQPPLTASEVRESLRGLAMLTWIDLVEIDESALDEFAYADL